MTQREYTVILEPEPDGRINVMVPALPEIATFGESIESALANAREAIELVIEDRNASGEEIPASDVSAVRIERLAVSA